MHDILNAFMLLSNFLIVPATAYGSQLALGALGVTLVYGILRFSNFAHGDTMAFGTMSVILVTSVFQSMGIGIDPLPTALLAIPFGILATTAMVLISDRLVYRHQRKVRAAPVVFLISSIGLMFVLNGLVRFVIGTGDQRFSDGERFIIRFGEFKKLTGLDEGIAFKTSQGLTIVTAIIVVAALFWFLDRTRAGKSMRAYSDNEDLALLSGINPERVVMITWIRLPRSQPLQELCTVWIKALSHSLTFSCCCPSSRPQLWAAWATRWAPLLVALSLRFLKSPSRMPTKSF